ncbi:MAG: AmmeMemoRadiSam system radical SAM enzyme [Candidatus Marinimicrobia bacterium]|nr:AmmeMemoRadiSam system radical SAM enzyme [Candidatus Neomarinimicrobiota bacterium]
MKLAKWWQALENQKIQCNLCPKNCIMNKDQSGFCKVRKNIDGKLYSMVYGKPVALNIDPIEKKPLYHFYPGTKIFSIGTLGCNFACKFCQNYDISQKDFVSINLRDVSPQEVIESAIANRCQSIAFTYNEPTVFGEYVFDIAKIAQQRGMKTVMVTNGFINRKPLDEIYHYIDAVNVDIKSFSEEFYRNICSGELGPVLKSIKRLNELGVFIEITNLIIPGINDNPVSIYELLHWIEMEMGYDIPLHFSAFHPDYKMRDVAPTKKEALDAIYKIAREMGFKYIYEGNVMAGTHDNTYCPRCGKLLIERNYFSILNNSLKTDRCDICGEKINIVL